MSHSRDQRNDMTGDDDLTRIEGIGPRRAGRLNAAGIHSYAGLASSSGEEIAMVLPDAGPANIDAWRDRARELAAGACGAPAEAAAPRHGPSAVLSAGRTPLRATEPFILTMAIELAEPASLTDRLAYSAVVVATPLTGGQKQTVAKPDGVLATTSPTIIIDATGLPPGAYRLDAAVSLREPGADHQVGLAGIAEGLLVQVLPG